MCSSVSRHWVTLAAVAAMTTSSLAAPNAQAQAAGLNVTRHAYPTGEVGSSVILLERAMPVGVRVGEAMEYELKLSNLTNRNVEGLILIEALPEAFTVTSITPEPDNRAGGQATWNLGTLGPKASKAIRFAGSAARVGELASCATVTFNTQMCSSTLIVQPALELVKTAPAEVILCDPIPLQFVVTNPGSGTARNVRIMDKLPDGWATTDGRKELVLQAGDLPAGASRQFSVEVRSSQTGQFENRASAVEDGGLTAEASAGTRVVRPVLALAKTGPATRYLGRPATYELTVSNEGDAPARDVMLVDTLHSGSTFLEASDGGRAGGGRVSWNLGTIPPGGSRTVTVKCKMTTIGTIRNTAQATGYCCEAAAEFTMEVMGIPAILLEVVDIHDPIEIGANETYEITVFNQGSAVGTNIVIACVLPDEQQFVSGQGPTKGEARGQDVAFAALPRLAPGETVKYSLVVKGIGVGDLRFRVNLTSDQLTTPVTETESTNVY
ncbi:MAG TPA: hypothetical protein VM243_01520 [Phycisphaerae bacterium]|nr:hypothetical protein [Phycisphaerae bacterium]